MKSVLPAELDFAMVDGVDGMTFKAWLVEMEQLDDGTPAPTTVAAVESAMGCRLYRGWPVCETEDVLRVLAAGERARDGRCQGNSVGLREEQGDWDALGTEEGELETQNRMGPPATSLSEAQAWDEYQRWFADWPRHRAVPYIDFHCRHITLGEVGAALSHIQLIESANRDGTELQLFFEDDARPLPVAVPLLLEEVARLERHGFAWDLIYLRASLYSKTPERPLAELVPGSRLFWAGHRKVTDAYCLSRRGIARIASSGFRECLFAFDDFLPSLHSEHPRRDVMLLPPVLEARGRGEGRFVGLSFGDAVLSEVARTASETNLSPCILGDHGAQLA